MNSIQKIESAVYAIRPELITEDTTYDPITLSDILLCLWEKSTQLEYCLTNKGNFYKTDWDIVGALLCSYNLRLSPYDQSEDTLQFIAENIK